MKYSPSHIPRELIFGPQRAMSAADHSPDVDESPHLELP